MQNALCLISSTTVKQLKKKKKACFFADRVAQAVRALA
jgi:hypothetical protein